MSGLPDVLARLETDMEFFQRVLREPVVALEPYPLTGEEILTLARELEWEHFARHRERPTAM